MMSSDRTEPAMNDHPVHVSVDTIPGITRIVRNYNSNTQLRQVVDDINAQLPDSVLARMYLSFRSGAPIYKLQLENAIGNLAPEGILDFRMNTRLCGGKGGFGSMLRAQGGRMSKKKKKQQQQKNDNHDNWRTVDGQRVRDLNRAKTLAQHLDSRQTDKKALLEQKRAKLERILTGSSASSSVKPKDNSEWLEDTETLVSDVKDSVEKGFKSLSNSSPSPDLVPLTPAKPPATLKGMDFFDQSSDDEAE